MEGIKHEIEVHGNAVQADPVVRVTHRFDRASIAMNGARYLHFPISTPTIVDGHRLKAGKVFVRFKTFEGQNASRISFVKVYDGDKELFGEEVNETRTDGGNISREFEVKKAVEWGVNVTLGVEGPAIDVIGVGIVFY